LQPFERLLEDDVAHSFRSLILTFTALVFFTATGAAFQGRSNRTPSTPPPSSPTLDVTSQPTFLSGKVLFEGGGAPSEPVVIERICNGTVRREGYTDSNGHFQFQVGQNPGFHDASESNSTLTPDRPNVARQAPEMRRLQLQNCELRGVLAGFQSSTVPIRSDANSWQIEVGAIFLKRMENVSGATISLTTMSAPRDARAAYEKAQKEFAKNKPAEAEKELEKAVRIYPNFAAAWCLLGDVHVRQSRFEDAMKEFTQSVTIDPQFVNPNFGLAVIAVQEKRWPDAAKWSGQVIKLNAFAFPSAYFYNAVANYYLERLDAAEESGRKFKAIDADHRHPDISLLLGDIRLRKNDYNGAATELREYLTAVPDAADASDVRARVKRYEELSVSSKK